MRIKKGHIEEEITIEISKTFDNIAARNLEIESLKDGDSVKVLDASDDPEISSGWAIYRFSKESGVFDLVEQETKDEIPETLEIDNNTIVENQDKKIVSFHSLNHGVGFEFPEAINMVFEPSGDSKSFNIIWSGMKNGVDTFGYKGHNYPLGIATKQVYSLQAKDNIDTYGFTHYVRISCHAGVVYWSSHVDYLTDIPSLEIFNYNGKQFLPLAFIKLVYNPDYTMKYEDCQVSHIYKNSVLVASPEEAAPKVEIDNKTIIENPAKELVSFHSLNQGVGFEFPDQTALNVSFPEPHFMKINWLNHKTGVDVFKYKGIEYKLGLRDHTYSTAGVKTNCDTLGFTHYARISAYLGYTYYGARCEMFAELPDLSPFVYSTKEYLPIGVIKLVFNPDYTLNLVETQISEIYKRGALVKESGADLGTIEVATYSGLNSTLKATLYNGQLVKVLDAAQDVNLKGGWAVYRFKSSDQSFGIVGAENYRNAKTYSTFADMVALAKNACLDSELIKVLDASGDPLVSSGWAFYRFRLHNKTFELVSKEQVAAGEKWDLDKQTVCETTYSEKQVLFNPQSIQTHRANFTILEDFGLKFSVGETYTGSKTFLLVEPDGGKRFIPVMSNGVKKYMNLIGEHVLMNDIFGASFAGNWKYFTLRAIITDTTDADIKNLGTSYENTGEPMQVFPYPLESQYYFVQIGVKFNADGKTIDDMRNIKIMPYWKQALDLGAIPTFDANTIDRSQVSEFSNQFSVPEAMHGTRQDQIILKDFDFDFSHDKDTKLISMNIRGGGGFKAIPILVNGVRKYIHLNNCSFDMSNFGFGFDRFHFAVSAPIRDTDVYSSNGMTNQYNGTDGSVSDVRPSKFDSAITIFQVSGTMPEFGQELAKHAFSVHKYWKKALAPFNDLYAEMIP